MHIEIKATGTPQELRDFQELLREGGVQVGMTDAGRMSLDMNSSRICAQFVREHGKELTAGMTLNRMK